jgi:cathepsin A (carboxypeptidase C)
MMRLSSFSLQRLTGGPGGSSSIGLLFELGPCSIRYNSSTPAPFPYTEVNPYSWTNYANMIFLDQPTEVGFSYSSDSSTVNTSPVAAEDVYAFLQLFLAKYDKLRDRPFHVAAESYGGTFAPNVGKVIYESNQGLKRIKTEKSSALSVQEVDMVKDFHHIPLKSLVLANGLTEPWTQYASVPDYLCKGPYAPLDPEGSVRIFLVFLYKFLTIHGRSAHHSIPRSRLAKTSSSAVTSPEAD